MAYNGYLLRIKAPDGSESGDWDFPHEYIKADTYSAYLNMQDLEPWTDANGYLHRNAVDLKAIKIEFETPAMLTNTDLTEIMRKLIAHYTNSVQRRLIIEAYIPEWDDYWQQDAYLADFTPQIYGIFDNVIKYNPIRFAFIGGLADD